MSNYPKVAKLEARLYLFERGVRKEFLPFAVIEDRVEYSIGRDPFDLTFRVRVYKLTPDPQEIAVSSNSDRGVSRYYPEIGKKGTVIVKREDDKLYVTCPNTSFARIAVCLREEGKIIEVERGETVQLSLRPGRIDIYRISTTNETFLPLAFILVREYDF